MMCRACWADRAEVCRVPRWKAWLAACVLAAPVKCRHCFYEFYVPLWSSRAKLRPTIPATASRAARETSTRKAA